MTYAAHFIHHLRPFCVNMLRRRFCEEGKKDLLLPAEQLPRGEILSEQLGRRWLVERAHTPHAHRVKLQHMHQSIFAWISGWCWGNAQQVELRVSSYPSWTVTAWETLEPYFIMTLICWCISCSPGWKTKRLAFSSHWFLRVVRRNTGTNPGYHDTTWMCSWPLSLNVCSLNVNYDEWWLQNKSVKANACSCLPFLIAAGAAVTHAPTSTSWPGSANTVQSLVNLLITVMISSLRACFGFDVIKNAEKNDFQC